MATNIKPKVDLILPFHRVDQFLKYAVESALNSKKVKIRLIAIDDRSIADDLPSYLNHPLITVFRSHERGYANAINTGIYHSEQDYVGFLNSDDLQDENRLINQIKFQVEQDATISLCRILKFNSRGFPRSHFGELRTGSFNLGINLLGFYFSNATWLINREKMGDLGAWNANIHHTYADWLYLHLNVLMKGHKLSILPSELYFQRVHEQQISREFEHVRFDPEVENAWKTQAAQLGIMSCVSPQSLLSPYHAERISRKKFLKLVHEVRSIKSQIINTEQKHNGELETVALSKDLTSLLIRRLIYAGFKSFGTYYNMKRIRDLV